MTMDEIDEVYAGGSLFAHRTNDAFQYSNLGFGMIGRCVRHATGRTVQEHITARFHEPLGMDHTTWVEPVNRRWARPFRWEDDAIVDDLPHPIGDGEISPMGGIWTTVTDLCRWISWLDRANAATDDRTEGDAPPGLSTASRRELQRMQTYIGTRTLADVTAPTGYGFGLVVRDDPRLGRVIDHSGGLPGYGSNMRWVAGRGIGVIALANVTYAPMSDLTMRMIYAVDDLGGVPAPRMDVAPDLQWAAANLVALLDRWDDGLATRLFADNMALDESLERRAAAALRLREAHGALRVLGVRPSSSSSAEIDVCGSGEPFRIEFDLAPLRPVRIQYYGVLTS
jgi:CubicO group peptidase (beta-lactamase class C family)